MTVASGSYDGIYIYNGLEWMNLKGQITADETTLVSVFLINNTVFCEGSTATGNKAKIVICKN